MRCLSLQLRSFVLSYRNDCIARLQHTLSTLTPFLARCPLYPRCVFALPVAAPTTTKIHTDTGSTQAHWPFPSNHVGQGYAYILTHPGMPCIFWDHWTEWGDTLKNEINSLIEVGVRVCVCD